MISKRPDSGLRAVAFAVALFAITLNFLQPLAHAALMRDGGSTAGAKTWGVFCLPAAGQDDAHGSAPGTAQVHECCLGLAHAPALAAPPTSFLVVEPVVIVARLVMAADALAPVGIRDGPRQPRGPPSFV